jgi:ribulose-5-phosphate 4-epimerase/fuculose-1-phosphate aldolase
MAIQLPDSDLVDKLVYANRILYDHGIVDGLGHVSVRHPTEPGVFLLSCNRAPAMVRRQDIVCYDFDGNTVSESTERPYLERFIHAELYRARPDVMSVVHSHSMSVIPFAITKHALKPVFHMSSFLGEGSAHFEIRDAGGNTDMLIRDKHLGEALAKSLGDCNCVLMRGHGSTVVGGSIEGAVFRAIYTEINARIQLEAQGLGEITFLNGEEARLATEMNEGQLPRSWNLWIKRLGDVDLDA